MNKNCSININGNVTGIQIQQNTVNSTQNQNVNEAFDYDKVLKILDEINMYRDMFDRAYNEKSKEVKDILDKTKQDCLDKKSPSIIKKSLLALKNITKEVSSNVTKEVSSKLITTGVLGLLEQIKF